LFGEGLFHVNETSASAAPRSRHRTKNQSTPARQTQKKRPPKHRKTRGVRGRVTPEHPARFLSHTKSPFHPDALDPFWGALHQVSHHVKTSAHALDDRRAQLGRVPFRKPLFHRRTHPE